MKILAIDAATEACSVALYLDGEVTSKFELAPQQHSQMLLPMVDQILADAGIALNQLDAIAYGQGPGSFTGVRIGVAITQGLAFAADLPVIGISSMAAMAQQVMAQHKATGDNFEQVAHVLVAIDARMSEVYFGLYQNVEGLAQLVNTEGVCAPQDLALDALPDLFSAGTGWQTYQQILTEKYLVNSTEVHLPSAEFMLPLAVAQYKAGHIVSAERAQPNYVRDEVSWKKLPGR
ncbi:tRNA (adenosine(37)-N6)-threonylcarbamoyltransferase complex dimerization subunit type 1 TsaB [Psychrosphaera sp. B3R10]|uniref:tRNA threonylcarbamoyladenosine biosynthesis protein TsaB n=1 Tax=Psychrosphaera algicola TaxID=3023714 RepID=A0ABT5FAC0_9GAMM|nr:MULTISPECIES: tRNA (adenosine(37)-N6)-threonylcarbamoyltransferase complex dimerization subunit type 1 TsaB [unclassified Psychrosphaera]MBU2883828.1 tRNA (adenosine(37)-N6)-threonylcarbamoyltransferase complex dimerization subunit type 1 TsaB [Psychrosphaera sp. I2R16]MBU2989662.1 tRNA (adenosine(37)-N6)-threonylcarbamoyltransferase complex dimerization subunit type 1 TsaB [Psychrosphaera sp. B3R10]MDC2888483.1 tRNA (adenosine(37)-N6)-threonylcarbamoyltransferase complex dimerization subunit